jgi:hypothetical protein
VKLVNWVGHQDVATISDVSYAYEVSSLATNKDGGVFTCDPFTASGDSTFTTFWDQEITDVTGGSDVAMWRNVVEGCMKYAPTSDRGKQYWVNNEEGGIVIDVANLTP